MQPVLRPGDAVRVRGREWVLHAVTAHAGCRELDLEEADARDLRGGGLRSRLTLLDPFDRPARLAARTAPRIVSRRAWMAALGRALLSQREPDGLVSAVHARIDVLAHQLEPAMAVVHHGFTRLLLADAVGLGKTIEAGLVLAELHARGSLARALVIAPPGLRDQWAAELAGRFGLDATVADAAWLRACRATLPSGVNPWSLPGIFIASFDFAKRAEVLVGLSPVLWDAFVLDEAHLAAGDSERRAAAHALATRARVVLLLTATPHSGDARAFAALCRIGSLDPEDRLAVFRRTRAQAGLVRQRRVATRRIRGTPAELEVRRALDDYIRRVWARPAGAGAGEARLAVTVLLKRSFSGMAPLRRSLETRLSGLEATGRPAAVQMPLAWDDELDGADEAPAGVLAVPGLADPDEERAMLAALAGAARAAEPSDSKLRAVLRLLRHTTEPVIVFTEYRDTLTSLQRAVGDRPVVLHGGLDRAARADVLSRFTSGGVRVLLATDAAGEGLNLHQRCRLVVNLELPWNPMRLEQRVGRVDRIGQSRQVRVVNLVAADTAEAGLYERLARRLDRARDAVGPMDDVLGGRDEDVVASEVGVEPRAVPGARSASGARPARPRMAAIPGDLTPRAAALAERLVLFRRLSSARRTRVSSSSRARRRLAAGGVFASACRASRLPPGLRREGVLAVFRVSRAMEGGRTYSHELAPVFVARPVRRLRLAQDVRGIANAFLRENAPALADLVRAGPLDSAPAPAAFDRDACIARRARRRTAVQRGLFDARAERGGAVLEVPGPGLAGAPAGASGNAPALPALELLLFITS